MQSTRTRARGFFRTAVLLVFMAAGASLPPGQAQELKSIKLNPPDLKRGLPFMEALSVKASAREWAETELTMRDLSDLLWAANGVNRPAEKKYTASSAMNAHDVDCYVCMKEGVYLYDADAHALNPVLAGDYRSEVLMRPPPRPKDAPAAPNPPVLILLVSDVSRFRAGSPELKLEWGAIDAGIVSQNISLFCAATGLKTVPRASTEREKARKLLSLKETQHVFLNHPVGYAKPGGPKEKVTP